MSVVNTSANQPKSMSARLLTMKFMQRATASQPSTKEEPSPKRRKTNLELSSPRRADEKSYDRNAVLDALASEEQKRQAALDKLATASGDTRWVIDYKDQNLFEPTVSLRVVHTGYAGLDIPQCSDSIDTPEEKPTSAGRRSFGRFNKIIEKQQNPQYEDSSESDSTSDENDRSGSSESESSDDLDDPLSQLIKTSRRQAAETKKVEDKSKKRAARLELEQPEKKKRTDAQVLNKLTSLSGRQQVPSKPKIECYTCGGPHRKSECPKRKRAPLISDDGPHKKIPKLN